MSQDELKLELGALTDEVKKVVRRVDMLQRSVDLLNDDRLILEDVVTSVAHLKQIVITGGNKTKEQIDEVKDKVEKESAVVRYSLVDELKDKFKRKNIEPKKPLWRRLLRRG